MQIITSNATLVEEMLQTQEKSITSSKLLELRAVQQDTETQTIDVHATNLARRLVEVVPTALSVRDAGFEQTEDCHFFMKTTTVRSASEVS